jgi:hypothetical protein
MPKNSIFYRFFVKKKWVAWERWQAGGFGEEGNTALGDFVNEMFNKGYICPMGSATVSNILLVKKPDGGYQTCKDYRLKTC